MRSPFADADIGAGRFCFGGSVSIVRMCSALGKWCESEQRAGAGVALKILCLATRTSNVTSVLIPRASYLGRRRAEQTISHAGDVELS